MAEQALDIHVSAAIIHTIDVPSKIVDP